MPGGSALDLPNTPVFTAVRAHRLERVPAENLADQAAATGIITAEERRRLDEAARIRDEVIQVDAFDDLRSLG